MGNRGIQPLIHDLGTVRRWVVTSCLNNFIVEDGTPRYPFDPRASLHAWGREDIAVPVHTLDTVMTELSRLPLSCAHIYYGLWPQFFRNDSFAMDVRAAVVMNCEPLWFDIHSCETWEDNRKLVIAMSVVRALLLKVQGQHKNGEFISGHGQFEDINELISQFTTRVPVCSQVHCTFVVWFIQVVLCVDVPFRNTYFSTLILMAQTLGIIEVL
jgi:hypothetical protein